MLNNLGRVGKIDIGRSTHGMRNPSLNTRLENALNAFFQTECDPDPLELKYAGPLALRSETRLAFTEKADRWSSLLRSLFLFGPGSFFLFFVTLSLIEFYPKLGLNTTGIFLMLGAAFFAFAGTGSITNIKNLAVPASVIALALIYSLVAGSFLGFGANDLLWYAIYLLPVVFVTGKFAQTWATKEGR